jgi:small subunit ribosomal protein S1
VVRQKVSKVGKVSQVPQASDTRDTSKSRGTPITMAELLASAKNKVRTFSVGQKIEGKVIAKNSKSLLLDIGGKSEGIVAEKAFAEARDFIKNLKVGDVITATVLVAESREGAVLLSLREASSASLWDSLKEAQEKGTAVAVFGKSANPAGVTVEIEGVIGFIPGSQLGKETAKNPQSLVGKYFKAKVLEINKDESKLVLSEKEVSEAAEIKLSKEILEKIKEGEIYDGEVTTVASFGCFVKLDFGKEDIRLPAHRASGPEGLVHISELSWGRTESVDKVVKVGDKVKVKVLGLKDGKLALSIRQALKNPWEEVEDKYKAGDNLKGKVVKISDFGMFVEIEPGVEGLVHLTQIPPGTRFNEGQEVNVYVEEIDSKAKKMSLGLVLSSKPVGYK